LQKSQANKTIAESSKKELIGFIQTSLSKLPADMKGRDKLVVDLVSDQTKAMSTKKIELDFVSDALKSMNYEKYGSAYREKVTDLTLSILEDKTSAQSTKNEKVKFVKESLNKFGKVYTSVDDDFNLVFVQLMDKTAA